MVEEKQTRQVIRQGIRRFWRSAGKKYPHGAQKHRPYVNNRKTYAPYPVLDRVDASSEGV